MSSARALAQAIRALAPIDVPHFEGQAPDGAEAPWVVSNVAVPAIVERAEAGNPLGNVGRVRLTVAAETEDAALEILDIVLPALEGQWVTASGWQTSPLRRVGEVRTYPDADPVMTSGARLMVGAALFEFAVTAIPA